MINIHSADTLSNVNKLYEDICYANTVILDRLYTRRVINKTIKVAFCTVHQFILSITDLVTYMQHVAQQCIKYPNNVVKKNNMMSTCAVFV